MKIQLVIRKLIASYYLSGKQLPVWVLNFTSALWKGLWNQATFLSRLVKYKRIKEQWESTECQHSTGIDKTLQTESSSANQSY